jgi:hypothetical protein
MACDCEIPCRECKEGGSEYCTDPAECGHAVLPSSDNLLERAFMARIRADEYREALAALQQEFDARPDVIEIKRRIERCEEERRQCDREGEGGGDQQAGFVPAQGPHPQGSAQSSRNSSLPSTAQRRLSSVRPSQSARRRHCSARPRSMIAVR